MKIIFISLFLLVFTFPVVSTGRLESSYFSRLPQIEHPKLSPDGKYLAFIQNVQGTETAVLSSIEVKTGKRVELLKVKNNETKFAWFTWANNRSLFVKYWNANNIGVYDVTLAKAIVLEADGSHAEIREFDDARYIIDYLPEEPDWVLVADGGQSTKVNIYTLKRKRHERRVRKMYGYITDQQHNIRVGTANTNKRTGKIKIYVRPEPDSSWEELFSYTNFDGTLFEPMGFGLDTNILYYKAYKNDKKALFKVELDTMTHSLVFADTTYDFDGNLIHSPKTRDIVGITHSHAPSGRIYWDKDRKKMQRSIDRALPGMDNYIFNFSKDENAYLTRDRFKPRPLNFAQRH
jgi:hypothetical protein